MNEIPRNLPIWKIIMLVQIYFMLPKIADCQVVLKDTLLSWQHHTFELNADNSMKSYSTEDTDIEEIFFTQAKLIENELIRLVIVPEYGGRVISFVYKPTGHEYLYQSECGSPYGINEGNFYYNWLMVYGGIFPTFPEPEHGKTWLSPWSYSTLKNSDDTVSIQLEYVDSTSYAGAPGQFNNGITNLSCKVEISVYRNSSLWDFKVILSNPDPNNKNYEYWTCTTLAPGSDPSDTGTPLNSEIIIPIEKYKAGWSPGSWIGTINGSYNISNIQNLSDWDNMGIAYAVGFDDIYWGVINHENEEGIFRISENNITKGVKFWTWGKNNIDNNMYDFSNGGADNYIELWAGVSDAFFKDAVLESNQEKQWVESYCATTGLSSVDKINTIGGVNLIWDYEKSTLSYELNTFASDQTYSMNLYLDGESYHELAGQPIFFEALGLRDSFLLNEISIPSGFYQAYFDLFDDQGNLVLTTSEEVNLNVTGILNETIDENQMKILRNDWQEIRILMSEDQEYAIDIFNLNGQKISHQTFTGTTLDVRLPHSGLYLIRAFDGKRFYTEKISL